MHAMSADPPGVGTEMSLASLPLTTVWPPGTRHDAPAACACSGAARATATTVSVGRTRFTVPELGYVASEARLPLRVDFEGASRVRGFVRTLLAHRGSRGRPRT